MRVFVTGVAGFVGSALAERLVQDGQEVVGVDAFTDYYPRINKDRNLEALRDDDRFTLVEGDLNDLPLERLLDGIDVVFHQAGQPGVRSSWGQEFSVYTRNNILATQRLLEASRASTLKRFVYASSSSVYGNAERYPTLETDRPQPRSPYGVTKLAGEHLCGLYASNFGVPTTSLRYFTVYGPRQRPDMAFTRFLDAAWNGSSVDLFGTGEQVRDFTFVDDVVEANLAAAATDTTPGEVFNVAGGSNVSMNQVISLIEQISGRTLDLHRREFVAGDVMRTGGSTAKIAAHLGWSPTISIEEGLSAHFDWIRGFADAR